MGLQEDRRREDANARQNGPGQYRVGINTPKGKRYDVTVIADSKTQAVAAAKRELRKQGKW